MAADRRASSTWPRRSRAGSPAIWTEPSFDRVLRPKLDGALVLDRLLPDVELFVVVLVDRCVLGAGGNGRATPPPTPASTRSCTRGGRAAHAAQSIQWGPWADVGLHERAIGDRAMDELDPRRRRDDDGRAGHRVVRGPAGSGRTGDRGAADRLVGVRPDRPAHSGTVAVPRGCPLAPPTSPHRGARRTELAAGVAGRAARPGRETSCATRSAACCGLPAEHIDRASAVRLPGPGLDHGARAAEPARVGAASGRSRPRWRGTTRPSTRSRRTSTGSSHPSGSRVEPRRGAAAASSRSGGTTTPGSRACWPSSRRSPTTTRRARSATVS